MLLKTLLLKNKPTSRLKKQPALKLTAELSLSLLVISFWLGITDWLEIYITEWRWIRNDLPQEWRLGVLILMLLIATLIITKIHIRSFKTSIILLVVSSILLLGTLYGHSQYKQYRQSFETIPKIKFLSKKWTINGSRIAIVGRNFGEPWQRGTIWLGDTEFIIVSWDDERIVAEQPVSGEHSGVLMIRNEFGVEMAVTEFEIKDPTEVLK